MSRTHERRFSTISVLTLLFAAASAIWNARDLHRHWDEVAGETIPGAEAALALRIGAACVELLLLAWGAARLRDATASWRGILTLVVFVPAAAIAAATLARAAAGAGPDAQLPRSVFFAVLLLGTSWVVAKSPPSRGGRLARGGVVGFNAIATCVLLEVALGVWARVAPSPLLFAPSLEARLAAARPTPFRPWFGGRLNAGGYHDEAFFTAGEHDLVVALVADSFGLGVVPYADNFVTIAEERLRDHVGDRFERVALHNFGVPGSGLEEYAHVLSTEALATNPALVVLCVFVGNDVTGDTPFGAPARGRFALQDWLLVELPRRLVARRRAPEYVAALERQQATVDGAQRIQDPPAFSPAAYLDLEARRLDVTDTTSRRVARRYERFFTGLDWFRERLGDRLLVLVFPDEFQVDDDLWRRALARQRNPEAHVRDLPQQRIATWASRHGVPLIDTTPALRAAQQQAPTYAPRNTHLNPQGNATAATELTKALLQNLE